MADILFSTTLLYNNTIRKQFSWTKNKNTLLSHRSTPTCAINRDSESGLVLFCILPFDYTFVWWRWVHSLPYLYTSVWAPSAFGSAFSLWPQRPDQGWTAPSCRDRQAARERGVEKKNREKRHKRCRNHQMKSWKETAREVTEKGKGERAWDK